MAGPHSAAGSAGHAGNRWGAAPHSWYWFKAEPHPKEFFREYHQEFIAILFGMLSGRTLAGWPQITLATLAGRAMGHQRRYRGVPEFADPLTQRHAISYYRDGLPFHTVHPDPAATHGERFELLSQQQVAEMWTNADGFEQHPRYANDLDFAPEDGHKRISKPTLWMLGGGLSRVTNAPPTAQPLSANPRLFADPFGRYFSMSESVRSMRATSSRRKSHKS